MAKDFDRVQKARHYNSHPCGIETKHVVRLLDFNLGCVFKYVVRREDNEHEDPVRGLRSAKFYLADHLAHATVCPMTPEKVLGQLKAMVLRHAEADLKLEAKRFYLAFAMLLEFPLSSQYHRAVDEALDGLIFCNQLQNIEKTP